MCNCTTNELTINSLKTTIVYWDEYFFLIQNKIELWLDTYLETFFHDKKEMISIANCNHQVRFYLPFVNFKCIMVVALYCNYANKLSINCTSWWCRKVFKRQLWFYFVFLFPHDIYYLANGTYLHPSLNEITMLLSACNLLGD